MTSYEYIQSRRSELMQIQRTLEMQLDKAPPGTLLASKQGRSYNYRYRIGRNDPVYIIKANRNLARRLAAKSVRKRKLADIKKELLAINSYLEIFDGTSSADEFLNKHEGHKILAEEWGAVYGRIGLSLLKNLDWINSVKKYPKAYEILMQQIIKGDDQIVRWKYEPDHPTADHQEERVIKTLCGIKVRSKSEAIYADELYRSGLLFIYEAELIVNGRIYHPDFLIFHPVTGEMIVFEYLGLMPDSDEIDSSDNIDPQLQMKLNYRSTNIEKIKNYILAGFLPGKTLLFASESKRNPLDTIACQRFIQCYFSE